MTLVPLSKQVMIEYVYDKLLRQGTIAANFAGECKYRAISVDSGETLKCAVGWFIRDEQYSKKFDTETYSVDNLFDCGAITDIKDTMENRSFLRRLQSAHDDIDGDTDNFAERLNNAFRRLASSYNLNMGFLEPGYYED